MLLALAFLGPLDISARSYAQEPRLTVSLKDVPLSKVFELIQQKTEDQFLYNDDVLAGAPLVSIHLKNATVSEILEACFKNTHLQYRIDNKTILVMAPQSQPEQAVNAGRQQAPEDVHGLVKDEKGSPIEGVSVILKGTNMGTTTDAEGRFAIEVPDGNSVLVFSYIGYARQERAVGPSGNMLVITLKLVDASMNDVVVVVIIRNRTSDRGSVSR